MIPKTPITRKEQYLAAIVGESSLIPEKPITREEQYLAAILEKGRGGSGTTDYEALENKPSINGVVLSGNINLSAIMADVTQEDVDNAVTGVKGDKESVYRTGNVNVTPANIGLGNVDNTSDANKPVSTAQRIALDDKVDKVTGKGLSTNDYTNADKAKVAAALTQHQDISGKVDKVTGKGLSTNDYTTAEKNKLLGIEAGAQVNEVTSEHYRSMMAMLNVVRVQDVGFQKQFENFRAVFENFLYVQGVPVYMTAVGVGLIRIRDAAAGQIHSITVDRSLSGQRLYVQLANSSGIADTNVTVNSDGVTLVSLATVKGVNTLYVTTSAYTFPPASGGGHGGHQGATYINLHTDENGQFAYDYWIPNHGVEAKVRYVQDSELGNEIARTVTYEDFLAALGLSVTYSVTDNPAAMQSAGKQLYLKLDGYPFGTQAKPTYAKTSYPNAMCSVYYVAEYQNFGT